MKTHIKKRWLREKLEARYGSHIFIADTKGRANVCFKRMVGYLLNEEWYSSRHENTDLKAHRIVLTVKLILSDIKAREYSTSEYPTNEDIEDSTDWERWIPESLRCFLQIITKSPLCM